MGTLALLVFLLVAADAMRRGAPTSPAPAFVPSSPALPPAPAPVTSPSVVPASYVAPAWPQVVPPGLPPFPSGGWTPDEPPGPGVVQQAWALLPTLWKSGAGTFRTMQTHSRWITYRATPMGTKKGVVAYRLTKEPAPTNVV